MARELPERAAAILDSASTWHGVTRREGIEGIPTLSVGGQQFATVESDTIEVSFPGKLPEAVVRHDLADSHEGNSWTALELRGDSPVYDAVALLRLSHLAHVSRTRRWRSEAFPAVDIDAGLAELDLTPGLIHLVREQARPE